MSKQDFFKFENNATQGEATIYIYGDIVTYDLGDYNSADDVVPHRFKNELNALGNINKIHVRINSGGGSVFAAYAIMNLLKAHKAEIITYNDGICASAATIIAMAGDKIITALGSVWMLHLPMTGAWGNAKKLEKALEVLNTLTTSMVDIYHSKTKIPKDTLREMLAEETWLTGTQALEKGLADEITELEVVAYLNEDRKTAFFNGQNVNLDGVVNKNFLLNNLPEVPKEQNPANEEAKTMTLEEFQANHPNLYEQIASTAAQEAIQAERNRMKAIDKVTIAGMEELTNKAKYETGTTAEALAFEILTSQKEKGLNFLNQAKADAVHLDSVESVPPPTNDTAQEEEEILAYLEEGGAK